MKNLINILCFCIPISSIRRPLRAKLKKYWHQHSNKKSLLTKNLSGRPVILWIDHSLGGGTDTYSRNQFAELTNDFDIVRMQYFPFEQNYRLTFVQNNNYTYTSPNLDDIYKICTRIPIKRIVINNLVSYADTLSVLKFISRLKHHHKNPHTSFRGHDFQSLCPSFNLLDCDGKFCNFTHCHGCEYCWKNKILGTNEIENKILRSGADTIKNWREQWGKLFSETVDDVIVFSNKIKEMFIQIYPQLNDKIIVIPHKTKTYPIVNIPKHTDINIAVLGNILPAKGRDVIIEMSRHLPKNTNIIVIGTMADAPSNIKITGAYNPSKLPDLMQRHKIDIVFIPSIWPETFSYTTSEAISMGLPVACYNMGAPSERVEQYSRGLVLNEISPKENLNQILEFIKGL